MRIVLCIIAASFAGKLLAQEEFKVDRRIPEEYETTGGHSLGLGNSGVASQNGLAAVKLNPALLGMTKEYSVGGGYNWPTYGREFYQAGVIDSQSANIAAGFIYNGFSEEFGEDPTVTGKDARTNRRASLALAMPLKKLSVGVSGQYIEATSDPITGEQVKGTTIGFGVAGFLAKRWKFGASIESMANKKVKEYAPRMVRAGISYLFGGAVIASFDVRQRERVVQMEQGFGDTGAEFAVADEERDETVKEQELLDEEYKSPEWMSFASVDATVYDMVRILGAYGMTMQGPERRSLSGGVAVGSDAFSLSFTASRPYISEPEAQQAINATINVSM